MAYREQDAFPIKRMVQPDQSLAIDELITRSLGIENKASSDVLGLTLVSQHELFRSMVQTHIMGADSFNNHMKILDPVVPSSLQPIERTVTGIKYWGRSDKKWQDIELTLDDSKDRALTEERRAFLKRAGKESFQGNDSFMPLIVLARVKPELATTALLKAITSAMPRRITLEPATTDTPWRMPLEMQEATGFLPPQREASEPIPMPPVRQLRQLSPGFIASLRHPHEASNQTD
jgi:hypothetical protein